MNDAVLDRLVRSAGVQDDVVDAWDLGAADLALRDEILAGLPARPRRRRPLLLAAAASVAVAGAITGTVASGPWRAESAYAADSVAAAERAPRLLVDAPGWRITSVLEYDDRNGEMHLSDGRGQIQVDWYPARLLDGYLRDRDDSGGKRVAARLLGRPATLFTFGGKPGEVFVELEGDRMLDVAVFGADAATYAVLRDHLRTVGTDQWLDALPSSVFSGDRRSLAITGMLRDVPLPPGYDPGPLRRRGLVSDRYQLGAAVAGDVGCAWFDRWFDARERGDREAAAHAGRVLRGSHDWAFLREMARTGDYPVFFWRLADATAAGVVEGPGAGPLVRDRVHGIGCSG